MTITAENTKHPMTICPFRAFTAARRVLLALALACAAWAGLGAAPVLAATGAKNFDHLTTGFPLTGQHESARCEDCHVRGIFKGTPAQCAACHTPGALVTAVMIPNNHFPTSQPCSSCHTTATFYGAHFPHSDVQPGTCSTCHNGVFAKGVTPNHIAIGIGLKAASCDGCHSTVSFLTSYMLPPNGHMPVSQPCNVCHSTNGLPDYTPPAPGLNLAPHMNHVGTGGLCLTCHATSGPAKQFSVTGFTLSNGAAVTLAPVVVYPMSQSGLTAPGTGPAPTLAGKQHIPAPVSCDGCHVNGVFTQGSGFTSGGIKHSTVSGQSCASCHTAATAFFGTSSLTGVPVPIPGTPGTPGATNHIPINGLDCAASGCHSANDTPTAAGTNFATNVTPALSSTGHTTVNLPCETCHTVGMTWKLQSATMVTPLASHIPPDNLAAGTTACSACHSATSFGTGGFKITSTPVLSVSGHNAVSTLTCATCHESADRQAQDLLFQGVIGNIYLRPNTALSGLSKGVGLDPYHGTPYLGYSMDCVSCHTTAPPFTSAIVPPGHIKLVSPTPNCNDCHSGGYIPGVSKMKHADVVGTCTSCHATSTVFLGTGQGVNGQPWQIPGTVGTPGAGNHIPINSLDCAASGCHANTAANDNMSTTGSGFLTGSTPALSAAGHTSVNLACETCHTIGMLWKMPATATLVTPASAHIPPDNVATNGVGCSSCHSPTSFGVGGWKITGTLGALTGGGTSTTANVSVMPPASHTAVASAVPACATCHESGLTSFQGVLTNIFLRPDKGTASGVSNPTDTAHGTGNAATADCASCHNPSSFAAGLPTNHIKLITPTPACTDCHSAGYGPTLSIMKHSDVTGTCTSCHYTTTVFSGSKAGLGGGQPWQIPGTVGTSGAGNHIPINSLDCAASGCHGNTTANDTMTTGGTGFKTGTTPLLSTTGHTTVKLACETCHAVNMAWYGVTTLVGATTAHIPPDNVAGTTALACTTCHSATTFTAGGFKLAGTLGTLSASGTTTSANVSVMSIADHTAVAAAVPTCSTCHESGLTSFQGVLTSIFLRPDKGAASGASNGADTAHGTGNAATADCAQCHNPSTFGAALPTNHIKLITPTPACTDCHAAGYGPTLSIMKHSDATGTCTSCHYTTTVFSGTKQGLGGGQPWQIPGTVGTSGTANHIPINSLDCAASGCHGNTTANDTMTTAGTGFKTGTTPLLSTTGHTTVNLACETCHAVNMAWYGVTTLVGATTAHIPPDNVAGTTALACTTCHSATTFTAGGWKLPGTLGTINAAGNGTSANVSQMTVAMHTSVKASVAACDSCHEAGLTSFQGVLTSIFLRPDKGTTSGASNGADTAHGSGNAATADCSTCHNPSSFTGALPTNHIPLITPTPACTDCHANGYAPGISTMKHTDVTGTCLSCHYTSTVFAGTGQGKLGQPWQIPGTPGTVGAANHFSVSTLDCAASGCHTASDTMTAAGSSSLFKSTTTPALSANGHTSITATLSCQSCHNIGMTWYGVTTLVTPAVNSGAPAGTHIPPYNATGATENCTDCHSATSFGTGGFKLTGTPGTITAAGTGTSANVSVMSIAAHTAVSTVVATCDTCHQQGLTSWLGVGTSIFLRPDQGASSGLSNGADTAHAATTATSGNPGTSDCGGCHSSSSFAGGAPTNHIPIVTGAVCTNCHIGGTGNNVTPTAMPHTGYVSGTCASCHNSATKYAGPVFTPATTGGGGTFGAYSAGQVAFQPRQIVSSPAVGASGGHIPILPTGTDCGICHLSFAAFGPGTAMVHTGITTGCATCHASGAKWYGETYTASPTVRAGGVAFSPAHVPITPTANATTPAPCEVCHSPTTYTSFGTSTKVNHTNSASAFMTYSGGGSTNNPNRSALRTPTCITCHNSGMKWYGVSLSTATMGSHQNSQAGDDCYYCHSNPTGNNFAAAASAAAAELRRPIARMATGPASHPGGSLLPSGGLTAGYTHVGVAPGDCVSCHSVPGGATVMPPNHLPIGALSCDACHRTSTWLPALYSHSGVIGNCASCHYPGGATAQAAGHMLTSRSCAACHNTNSWTPQSYIHADLVYSPHPPGVTCVACHTTNTEQVTWKFPSFAPGCAGCHGPQFSATQRGFRSKGPAAAPPRLPQ